MIKHIRLHGIATYTEPVDINLKDINFIYGGNGTGKTTISKLISREISNPSCSVDYEDSAYDSILVYNKSFIENNFREVSEIAGIFTLGKDSAEKMELIKRKEKELDEVRHQISVRESSSLSLQQEINDLTANFDDECWALQVQYGGAFSEAMKGPRKSKRSFSAKSLAVYENLDGSPSLTVEELTALYHAAYSKEAKTHELYQRINLNKASQLNDHSLLSKSITGKAESDIGKFILYLKSSDWVKQGTHFAKSADGKCPYCSQPLPESIRSDIEAFFDETYQSECAALEYFSSEYSDFHGETIKYLADILANPLDEFTYDELASEFSKYQRCIESNLALIQSKISAPSSIIEIESCNELLVNIDTILLALNSRISENNRLVENQKDTQRRCEDEVWRFIVTNLMISIKEFKKKNSGKQRAKDNIAAQIKDLQSKEQELSKEIKQIRTSISSVQQTIEAINHILNGYGFTGFLLAENETAPGTYKIVRPDGSDAQTSLSEGEYNFITFLYFYHLILGSSIPEEIVKNKVIVIDDPISSLDSNVLFIVSSLVKNIIALCRNGEQSVKQVIICTHNIYFHKEITFVGNRDHWPEKRTSFFILRKKDQVSSITEYSENQIQSSYEMLWDDIRKPENGTAKSIFNTMRRILENYFNIIGGIDYERCVNEFEGEDKLICKSLISCINEQSHTISDDYFMCIADSEVDHYLRVFRDVFTKMNHLSHYNMMMRIEE